MENVIELKDYTAHTNVEHENYTNDEVFEICEKVQKLIAQGKYKVIDINGKSLEKPSIFSIDYSKNEVKARGYVGLIKAEVPVGTTNENGIFEGTTEVTIKISSRFDHGKEQYFLSYIFSETSKFDGKIFENMNPDASSHINFDILLVMVFLNMLEEATKLGLYRKYRTFEYNDSKFKGKLDINRHIKLNLLQNGKIAYSTREYTVDNSINHLILLSNDLLEKEYAQIYRDLLNNRPELKHVINNLKGKIPDYKSLNPRTVLKKATKPISHPYYYRYEGLRKICILILRRLGYNVFEETGVQVFGIVIDMANLWENFLEEAIVNKLICKSEKYNKSPQDTNMILKIEDDSGNDKYRREIKPDFTIYEKTNKDDKKEYIAVFDAKYRAAWGRNIFAEGNKETWNSSVRNDVFQVFAYMLALNCGIGGVIFPVNTDEKDKDFENYIISKYCKEKYFYSIPYVIPYYEDKQDMTYEEFKNNMDEQNGQIIKRLNNEVLVI